MNETQSGAPGPIVIQKYANRRLYNTHTSSYVTLDHLCEMVKEGVEFEVRDARTGEDITRQVLAQIIFDEENKGQHLLPIQFLRQLGNLGIEADGLRVEAFNVTNHPQFGDPVRFLDSPLFGRPVSMLNLMLGSGTPHSGIAPAFQTGGPRVLQFTVRVHF